MKSALLRKSILTLGISAAGLILTPSDSFAGAGELKLLNTELAAQSTTLATADANQLLLAVRNVITNNPKKNPGIIAGEALKGAGINAANFGILLGQAIESAQITIPDLPKFIGFAAKTANTGKLPNGSKVVDFANQILGNDGNNDVAIAAAKVAIGSKSAAGQILGGRAASLSDTAAGDLAEAAAIDSKLKGGIQAISQFVGAQVDNTATFATDLLTADPRNIKLLTKIAPGAAAGKPVQAADILEALFANGTTKPSTVKSVTTLAKSMSLVADTEVVTDMAIELGARITANDVPFSKLTTLAKGLVTGLTKKPSDGAGLTPTAHGRDSLANKLDEIGEVGAYLLNAVATRAELDDVKKAPNLIIKLMKTIIATARIKSVAGFQAEAADDVAGSIALTLVELASAGGPIDPAVLEAVKQKFLKASTAKSIGGKNAAAVQAAVDAAFGGTSGTKYEDGTEPGNLAGELTGPETDIRNG